VEERTVVQVAVIGAGAWGTTVAALLAPRVPTTLWARDPAVAASITRRRRNDAHLPEVELPASLQATSSLEDAVAAAGVVVVAVPSHGFRSVLGRAAAHVADGVPVVSLAKGLEVGTHRRMTEVAAELLPGSPVGALTGPNLAAEIAAGQPAASVLAMEDQAAARGLRDVLGSERFRVYTNPDVVGCELAGALKNVIAIAAGMVAGMGLGHNSLAAVVTRGLAELSRLGVAMGGDPRTFPGLAGLGDLVVTCFSPRSRNRGVGEELGRGRALADILAGTTAVAEGVRTSSVVVELAGAHGVEVPICAQVAAVCHDGRAAPDAARALLLREATAEWISPAVIPPPHPAPTQDRS
jgi:glycerol-3-phosphate dehydrogenase (NAD(P)+)